MSQVFTGVRAVFKIQGTPIAFASNCSYNWNHNHQAVEVLDKLEPTEYAEIGYTVDFSCTSFRVADKSAIQLGVQPVLEAILTQPELVVELQDKVANKTILRITGVKMQSRSGTVDARGTATETWSFVGLRATDESTD